MVSEDPMMDYSVDDIEKEEHSLYFLWLHRKNVFLFSGFILLF